MTADALDIFNLPDMSYGRMVIGLSGWMDGGDVSTGTVECLIDKLGAYSFARIKSEGFFLYNFPASMEMAALFRPYVNIRDGQIKEYQEPRNIFFCEELHQLILFVGKEPHLHWHAWADAVMTVAEKCNVGEIYFIGSVAGLVPHTRDPRLSCTVSHPEMLEKFREMNIKPTEYQGPGSIVNYLTLRAKKKNIRMANLVAEIPAYVQGKNPKCIGAVAKRIATILNLEINLDDLRQVSDELEKKLDQIVKKRGDLAEHITVLEENYDKEFFDNEMGDLKKWLIQQGIRLD